MTRSSAARLAAHQSWALTADRASRTAPARAGLDARFEREARERLGPDASDRQVAEAAESARRAHYAKLSAAGVAARQQARAASAPTRSGGPSYTRVYRPHGKYAHLRADDSSGVRCPVGQQHWRWDEVWLGTGSQAEYETAAALPLCPRCWELRERRLSDPRLGSAHGREMAQ